MELNEKMYHIGLCKEDIKGATYAILPGDPGRVLAIAKNLEEYYPLAVNREYTSYLGKISDINVLIISTGMGGPSTAICVEELAQIGIKNLIRVGTCGGMQIDVMPGDLIIANSAIRQEGTSKEYLPIEFPAVANFDLVNSLKESATLLNEAYHIGTVQCKDSFYGQHNPERMPISYELENKWQAWIKGGALASEMETASLYITASTLHLRAAAILLVILNQEREKKGLESNRAFDTSKEIKVAIKAIELLIAQDNKKS